uniref:Uncharacterized protein n=1 Tax=Plectus sambesii TaxID=2011161 RepID=A0A914V279_9BILA
AQRRRLSPARARALSVAPHSAHPSTGCMQPPPPPSTGWLVKCLARYCPH